MLEHVWNAFNHNAGAVEALAALAALLLTTALIWVTGRYTHTTQDALRLSQRQIAASFQPQVTVKIVSHATTQEGLWSGVISFRNVGSQYFKVSGLTCELSCFGSPAFGSKPQEVPNAKNCILAAGAEKDVEIALAIDVFREGHIQHSGSCQYYAQAVLVLEDLAGFGVHTFSFDSIRGLKYLHFIQKYHEDDSTTETISMGHLYKKWLIVGAAGGTTLAVLLLAVSSLWNWYSSRPKPWDRTGLTAQGSLWMIGLDDNMKPSDISLDYTLENKTGRDIRFSGAPIIMERPESNTLFEVDIDHVDVPSIIPANESVQIELHTPLFFNNEHMKGFTLYYPNERIAIDLPKPSGPTEEERKKLLQ